VSSLAIAALSFVVLLALIFVRVPIGLAMLLCGVAGTTIVTGSPLSVLSSLKSLTFDTFSNYSLTIVPLFLLMGQFAGLGGMSQALFRAADAFLGRRRGGLAMATIGACAGFGAICGSSLATAATMAQVALPEMKRYGYSGALRTGTLAAGGTLGILIPPSFVLVIYAILAEQNIAKLFVAAFVPGILAAIGYIITIAIYVRVSPDSAPLGESQPRGGRLAALVDIWPVAVVFLLVVGGIYAGWFTPTEGAAVGAAGTGLIALARGGLGWRELRDAILGTAISTAFIFFIVLGAGVYNTFLALAQLPNALGDMVLSGGFSPWLVLAVILVVYLILGCVMDSLSMILLTVPIFYPLVMALDFGLSPDDASLWFGILVLIVVEVGLITPPVGLNLFIINSMSPGVSLSATYRGVLPFVASDLVRTTILTVFPVISLFMVHLLF
jgi:C4-dicarboxylate transporter, DctM subunit